MKTFILLLLSLSSTSAFATDYFMNGIQFKSATILTQLRNYSGNGGNVCEIQVFLKPGFFNKNVMKGSRAATCNDLSLQALSRFVISKNGALAALFEGLSKGGLKDAQWDDGRSHGGTDSESKTMSCSLTFNPTGNLYNLCNNAGNNGSFSTED